MIGKFGPYVSETTEQESGASVSIPDSVFPGTLTESEIQKLLELKKNNAEGPEPICFDDNTGNPVFLLTGKFGPYFQLGEKSEANPKPKRFSVPKGRDPESISCEEILKFLSLPRELGKHPESGDPVIAQIGPYGPYVGCKKEFRSLSDIEAVFTVTLEEALKLLAAPKQNGKSAKSGGASTDPVVDFGEYDGKRLGVYSGRYGFYGKIGDLNFYLPKEMKHDQSRLSELTKEQMIELSKSAKPAKRARKKR
jgi:DNA topoisomerase-1